MMPLLQTLDSECGIGYADIEAQTTDLVDDLVLPARLQNEVNSNHDAWEQLLFGKLIKALKTNTKTIIFSELDYCKERETQMELPPSMALTFRLLEGNSILLENCGGSSAVNLLGRFAHGNESIHQLIKEIIEQEEAQNDEVLFAEIVHLPENRVGNVLLRPSFRNFEIPFLAKTSLAAENTIALQDLWLSVKGEKVELYSKSRNKRVMPRLSTAHNFSSSTLPVYQFLAELQHTGKKGIRFSWGCWRQMFTFLPRAIYGNIVLAPAEWLFKEADLRALKLGKKEDALQNLEDFRKKWQLPQQIVIADGDNELFINLGDELDAEILMDLIQKRKAITMKEYLQPRKEEGVCDEKGDAYANQFIAPLVKQKTTYTAAQQQLMNNTVTRKFLPGSNWVYHKFYCGVYTADSVLEALGQNLSKLIKDDVIERLFFIRYNDPSFHIRLRVLVKNELNRQFVIDTINHSLATFYNSKMIWKVQQDTYVREIERYGADTMDWVERIFHFDSMLYIQLLKTTPVAARNKLRLVWATQLIDDLLQAFKMNLIEKSKLLQQLKEGFHAEFKADKPLREQLSLKYREYTATIFAALNTTANTPELTSLQALRAQHQAELQGLFNKLIATCGDEFNAKTTTNRLLPSLIHMLVNRIAISKPREHELVIYDLLSTYYKAQIAMQKQHNVHIAK